MPRAARTCSTCHRILPAGTSRCPTCIRTADQARGTAAQRGYTSRGHKHFRTAVLTRDPICVLCHTAWSTVADHHPISRRDLIESGADPNNPACGRGLCKRCHDRETARHQPGGWNQPTNQP